MARLRSLKPEFWHDRKLARRTSLPARMLYMGLWNHADEHARANGDPAVIKGQVFPYDGIEIEPLLDELESAGVVVRYQVDGDPFLYLPKLSKHQRLEPSKVQSRFPSPEDADPDDDPPKPPSDLHAQDFPDPAQIFPDESEKECAKHVAGGMEHVAGGMGTREKPRAAHIDADSEVTAQTIVESYVEGCRSIGAPDPDGRLCGKVGKQAKAMLARYDPQILVRAAFNMGAAGWSDLSVQIQRDAVAAKPPGSQLTPRNQRNLALVERMAQLDAQDHKELA